jgi:hypothetical protein
MEDQQQLFTGAVESALLQATYRPGEGWACTLKSRRQFQDWGDARTESYERLTTDELLEVLDVSLATLTVALGG